MHELLHSLQAIVYIW